MIPDAACHGEQPLIASAVKLLVDSLPSLTTRLGISKDLPRGVSSTSSGFSEVGSLVATCECWTVKTMNCLRLPMRWPDQTPQRPSHSLPPPSTCPTDARSASTTLQPRQRQRQFNGSAGRAPARGPALNAALHLSAGPQQRARATCESYPPTADGLGFGYSMRC